MKNRSTQPLSARVVLTFTALSQVTLYLWFTGRVTGTFAVSALAGVLVFGLLVKAVCEVLSERFPDLDDRGPITDWASQRRKPPAAAQRHGLRGAAPPQGRRA